MDFRRISLGAAAILGPLCFVVIDREMTTGGLLLAVQALLMVNVIAAIAHGADWLVDSACRMAQALGISHLVIGLTIVAFATSMPELLVTVAAALQGVTDVGVGNVVGSNIANMLLILGSAALISPLGCAPGAVRRSCGGAWWAHPTASSTSTRATTPTASWRRRPCRVWPSATRSR